jgi:hypothetical protein
MAAVIDMQGLYNGNPVFSFKGCVFKNNSSQTNSNGNIIRITQYSAGVSRRPQLYFENCAFINNISVYGNIFLRTSNLTEGYYPNITFVNTTMANNSVTNGNGGCITVNSDKQTVNEINCTIKGNTGHGIMYANIGATLKIYNSIIENNSGNDLRYNPSITANTQVTTISNSLIFNTNYSADYYSKPASYTVNNSLTLPFDAITNSYKPLGGIASDWGDPQYLQDLGVDSTVDINYDQNGKTRLFENDKCSAGAIERKPGIYLSEIGDDINDGSEDTPVATLPNALTLAGGSGKIYVSGTISVSNIVGANVSPVTGTILTNATNLTIQGIDKTSSKFLMDGTCRAFFLNDGATLNLKNLTISGTGSAISINNGQAGFLYNRGSFSADNVTFEQFKMSSTGGVFYVDNVSANNLNISLKNCVFKNNSATSGACIHIQGLRSGAKVHIENCAFMSNESTSGNGGGVIWIRSNTNTETPVYPEISIINSTITGCTGNPAITLYSGTPIFNIVNSTIKDNSVVGVWAFQYLADARINIYNSIIEGNTTRDLYLQNQESSIIGSININNSFINNTNNTEYSKPIGYTATNQLLNTFDATTNTFKPKANSLAINYGDTQYLTALNIDKDQLGVKRNFANNLCDAGAVEYAVTNWNGATSTSWSDNSNWSKGTPTKDYEAIIPSGKSTYPVLATDEEAEANDLTLEAGAELDLGEGSLTATAIHAKTSIEDEKWYSIGFPFAVTDVYSEEFAESLLAKDGNTEGAYWLESYNGSSFAEATTIAANTGYIIQLPNGYTQSPTGITYSGSASSGLTKGTLTFGSDYALQANPNFTTHAIELSGNQHIYRLKYTEGEPAVAEYVLSDGETIAPYEAALTVDKADAPQKISLNNDVVTRLETPNQGAVVARHYYNLQGVEIPTLAHSAGVVIVKTVYESGAISVSKIIKK